MSGSPGLRLWVSYFWSKLRRGNPAHKAAAEEETARARDLAQEIMEREKALLDAEGMDVNDKVMLSIELQFLWGVFRELVQEYPDLPTHGLDRVKLHLIMRLVDAHGYSFEAARNEAISVGNLYNEADTLFDALASLGQKAFHDGRPGHLLKVAKVLQGTKAFRGMISKLEWSSNPSAHEAHLIRRHNNPYFPEERRVVRQDKLDEAKRRDKEDCISCQQKFAELGTDIESLSSNVTTGDLLSLRERLDDLIYFSMGVGGPAKEIAVKADQLRDGIIADLREAFSDNEETLENIETADAFHRDNTRKFYIPVLAQVLRKNSPVLKEETIPTILSADPLAISVFMESLPDDTRALVRLEALKMMQEALNDGHIDPQFEEKVSALEGKWHFVSSERVDVEEGSEAAHGTDYAAVLRELQPLAEQGDAEAQLNVGHMHRIGDGVPLDYAKAVRWYRMAADQGHAEAQTHLGAMYHEGQGVPQDYKAALKWFRKAAEQGNALAQAKIGFVYLNGQGVPLDFAEAMKWFQKAAEQGDADARRQLGTMYAEGQGAPQDYAEAVKWVREAAKQGDANAQFQLGCTCAEGLGVLQSDAEASKWYRMAAEQGHADAQYTLGLMYAEGRGVPQDDAEVVKWFRKAAEQGMALAQGKIGVMYAKGQGVPRDYVLAHKWIALFAARGDARSDTTAKMLDFLASEMTPAQIAGAQRLAREWTAEFEKRSKN